MYVYIYIYIYVLVLVHFPALPGSPTYPCLSLYVPCRSQRAPTYPCTPVRAAVTRDPACVVLPSRPCCALLPALLYTTPANRCIVLPSWNRLAREWSRE